MTWSEDTEAALRRLWAKGLSCSQIGARLGMSRNAIIGKVHRLHLGGRKGLTASKKRKPPKTAPFMRMPATPKPKMLPIPTEPPPPPDCQPVNLLKIGFGQCRWPIGDVRGPDTLFCAAPVASSSWCAYHAQRAGGVGTPSERAAVKEAERVAA